MWSVLGVPPLQQATEPFLTVTNIVCAKCIRHMSGRHRQPKLPNLRVLRKVKVRPPQTTQRIGIIGAPLVHGQPLDGAENSPNLLRMSGITERLERKGARVHDYGDLHFDIVENDGEFVEGCKFARTVGKANLQIAERIPLILKTGRKVLLLGGDHSVALGSVTGHTRFQKDIALIWVDAHPDINTPLTSPSGHLHGMPVGFLCKELPHITPPAPGLEWCTPCISAKNIAYIGLRAIDPKEKQFIDDLNICAFTAEDVNIMGMDLVMERALSTVDPGGKLPIHLSFDVDALDPEIMPATGTPVPNGLSMNSALALTSIIYKTGRLSVMDVVELNPKIVSTSESLWSVKVVTEIIIRAFCGKRGFYKRLEPQLVQEDMSRED